MNTTEPNRRRWRRPAIALAALAVVVGGAAAGLRAVGPATGLEYVPDQAVMPAVRFDGSVAHVSNVRSFVYDGDSVVERRYVDRAYDLDAVRRVWFGLSPFASWRGPAHAFLSFELADGQFLSVSVEARKEVGESYSPARGLARRFELMYVIGDETDVIGLRTQVYDDPVYLYPARATPRQAGQLLEALLRRAEKLRTDPEFYNTFWNNCATNLADAINQVTPDRVRWNRGLVLPGYSDTWAARIGLLDIHGDLETVREDFRINERARAAYGQADFSLRIRQPIVYLDESPAASVREERESG